MKVRIESDHWRKQVDRYSWADLSPALWSKLSVEIRAELLAVFRKKPLLGQYMDEIKMALYALGRRETIEHLNTELARIGREEKEKK